MKTKANSKKFINIKKFRIKSSNKVISIYLFKDNSDEIITLNISASKLLNFYLEDLISKKIS